MKTTITIEDGDVRISFLPEGEIERLCLSDLGDHVSVSRSHQSIVLRPRGDHVRQISDAERLGVVSEIE